MNFETIISFLSHSNWGFLALLVLLLVVAFVSCFRDTLAVPTQGDRPDRPRL